MNKRNITLLIVFLVLIVTAGVVIAGGTKWWVKLGTLFKTGPTFEFQKGMCYVTWNKDRYLDPASDKSLENLAETGTNWVAIVTTWYQDKVYSTDIFPTADTPSDESLIHAIEHIHKLGRMVMLKPHLDIRKVTGGGWRGEICFTEEGDWKKWISSYRNFILHYARLAQENGVEMLCIGTELSSCATVRQKMWKDELIDPIKGVYKGSLTYAANWQDEYQNVKFWDDMDYVGIDAYFPISDKESPSLEEIRQGWKRWVNEIEEFQREVSKPIIFTEIGYCSAGGTASTPWQEISAGKVDLRLQADCYEALLQTFWDKPYFYGVYWWKWGTDVRFGGPSNKGFSLQNKPAVDVVTTWYKKPGPWKDPSIFSRSTK